MGVFKQVLSDKTFWVALVGLVAGIAVALGVEENLVATISGGILSVVSAVMLAVMGVKTARSGQKQTPQLPTQDTETDTPDQEQG